MSKISTLHDAVVTKVSTNLSTYNQLPNPYALETNNTLYLAKGFGVAVGPGNRTNRVIGCQTSWLRTFTVLLTNKVTTTEHNLTARQTIAKNILEDHYTLLKQFDIDADLSGNAIDGVVSQDGGIEYLEIDSVPYVLLSIDITVEYLEDLT